MQFRREITFTDIGAIVTILTLILGSYVASATRQATHEEKLQELEKARVELKSDLSNRLDRIESKLDAVISRGNH
jgi:hypothetical protein